MIKNTFCHDVAEHDISLLHHGPQVKEQLELIKNTTQDPAAKQCDSND